MSEDGAHEPEETADAFAGTPDEPADGVPVDTPGEDDAPPAPPPGPVAIDVVFDPRINFAMHHNAVPAVKRVALTNQGELPIRLAELRLWIDREISGRWTRTIERLEPGATVTLDTVDLPLRADTLAHTTERDSAELRCELRLCDAVIAERRDAVEVLAFDEWAGVGSLPEALAAFVTPNHPAVDRLMSDVRKHLELDNRYPDAGALSGYQRRDPGYARAIVQAAYRAVGDLALGYITTPASFEEQGQRVRLPDQVTERRQGNCLDLSLLLAAVLEQCGLHPLVVLVKGHAFVACWLHDDSFPEPAVTEPLRLRKRVQLGEILALEATGLTHQPAMTLDAAEREAMRRLEDPAAFYYTIDIASARRRRIRPLPLRIKPGTYDLIDLERTRNTEPRDPASPDLVAHDPPLLDTQSAPPAEDRSPPVLNADPTPEPESTPGLDLGIDLADTTATQARLDRWKRKLLDLSLRNRILNHRDSRKHIPLTCPDPARLEDLLADGRRFELCPRDDIQRADDPRSAELHTERTGEDPVEQFLRDELTHQRIYADLTAGELDKRLLEIYRAARLMIEESGANTLYLAIGFLEWYETPSHDKPRRAPVLLVPVELERLPAQRGYRLSQLDDEPRINVTLLEKLRTEYDLDVAGLDELPLDDAGLDVPKILRRFRQAVKDIARWDIKDDVGLGLFSFTKFLMWRDLEDRSEALMQSTVVRHLVEQAGPLAGADTPLPDPAELDATRAVAETFCAKDADSSQLAAVFAAQDGHSFVLEGPPGTGKSQTITNLIAQMLAQGKRVLFVSEKMAALSVVYKRLSQIGLAPFCLELHSNKANKRRVLEQLSEALDAAGVQPPEGWQAQAHQLQAARDGLNAIVSALHAEHPIGLSFYQATAELIGLRDVPALDLGLDDIASLNAATLQDMRAALDKLATAALAIADAGGAADHPYRAAGITDYATTLPDRLRDTVDPARDALTVYSGALGAMLDATGFAQPGTETHAALSAEDARWLIALGTLLHEPVRPAEALLRPADWAEFKPAMLEHLALGRQRDAERQRLFTRYREAVLDEDLDALRGRLVAGMTALPIVSWFKCRGPRKRMKMLLVTGKLPGNAELVEDLDALRKLKSLTAALADPGHPASAAFGHAWRSGEADWDQLDQQLDWAERYREQLAQPTSDAMGDADTRKEHAVVLACAERDRFLGDGPGALATTQLRSADAALSDKLGVLNTLMAADTDLAWGSDDEPARLHTVRATLEAWSTNTLLLRDWCHYRGTRDAAIAQHLGPLVTAYESRLIGPAMFQDVLTRSVLTQWHAAVSDAKPELGRFASAEHERQIDQFRALDKQYLDTAGRVVYSKLAERVPLLFTEPSANSEVGILKRQMKLKRRHMPVRQLLQALPNLLPRIKPCLLMSPLSVAQYLDADHPPFDLVVFDEASQIPVWDAVGAIARGTSCVVVGDSKQLPPTSFFQKLEGDDGVPDENDFEELESILDECSAAGLPSMRLLWHYRSRHESLITFSNYHYYDNRLFTFPSPVRESLTMGVSMRYIEDGVYDRGRTCTNPAEAEQLVAEIVERLTGYDDEIYQSIGVVTFSMAQQTLIEDLLDAARRDHPAIDRFFTDAVEEPVFVKNLENVQGDERAEIFFSVCYGPDTAGKVAMNFGPLNREGGERRLNVAITRARRRVVVFSSLRADQIDLSRTQQIGVKHLRSFLDYAQRGPAAIGEAVALGESLGAIRPFERAVEQAVRTLGYDVDRHVGASGYRVVLGVRDPRGGESRDATAEPEENPGGRYLLGIECDGPIYASAPAARDRDRTRPGVMGGLGWRLHRVWSADWWHDPASEQTKLLEAIERALRGEEEQHTTPVPEASADGESHRVRRTLPRRVPGMTAYKPYVASRPAGDSDGFYDAGKTTQAVKSLLKAAEREAPIHHELLARRVAGLWGVTRLTGKAQSRVDELLQHAVAEGQLHMEHGFVWLASQSPAEYAGFRAPMDGGEPLRHIEEVPPAEVGNAALAVLDQMIALPREELDRAVAELFGFSRVTSRVQPTIDQAVQGLLDAGRCVLDENGNVALPAGQ